MQQTRHIKQRMSQRGISREMVELVLDHGVPDQDKYVLGRKDALRLLEDLQRSERLLKKILDKGGLVVVANGDALITTYNYKQ
ncbi:DUF4258 domain-containing protein [Burkholderia sp. SR8]|uniref:DUF4258 domain-containing protein n=1 Tax=Burkholderia sp. SR8 TaxID=3062277 RepID=UPI004063A4E6